MNSMRHEFETHVQNYVIPFLVMYSVENCKPSIDEVLYDSLVLSIPDLPANVATHINEALASNYQFVVEEAEQAFLRNLEIVAKSKSLFGDGARLALKDPGSFIADHSKIRKTIYDTKKNIRENRASMQQILGEAFRYFDNVKFIY